MDGNANDSWGQNDPFGEEEVLPTHPEELRARAQQVRQDNQDAIRHYVELLVWGMLDRPDLVKVLLGLLYLWEDVETQWLAEACCMSLRNTIEVAEEESPVTFNCLDCGRELPTIDRQHQIRRLRSHNDLQEGGNQGLPRTLLCAGCAKRRDTDEQQQRKLDQRRYRAILRDYRLGSYEGRRTKEEWAILKREITLETAIAAGCATAEIGLFTSTTGHTGAMLRRAGRIS